MNFELRIIFFSFQIKCLVCLSGMSQAFSCRVQALSIFETFTGKKEQRKYLSNIPPF